MNPVGTGPNSKKMVAALSKLKWLVVVENVETETAIFWKAPKELRRGRRRRRSRPRSSCSRPPTSPRRTAPSPTRRAGCSGSGRRSIRRARPRPTRRSWPASFLAVRDLYQKEGGALPEQVAERRLGLHEPGQPRSGRGPEGDERQGPRRTSRTPRTRRRSSSRRASSSTASASSRTTARRCAATGCTPASTPRPGTTPSAATTPTRRVSACSTTGPSPGPPTGASCTTGPRPTPTASPGIATRAGIRWNGEKWVGDVPDIKPDAPPGDVRRLHHDARGRRPALRSDARTTARSPSTTRRSKRRSRTRCIRR